MTVRELIAELRLCDPDSPVCVELKSCQPGPDWDEGVFVVGVEFEDMDDEMSREVARKRYGTSFLRQPVLVVADEHEIDEATN